MFNVVNKISCAQGKRESVASFIAEGARALPGCRLYSISLDREDENAIWVYELWESEQHHADSLNLQSVRDSIEKARPFITGAERVVTSRTYYVENCGSRL